jgi:cobalamin synthase
MVEDFFEAVRFLTLIPVPFLPPMSMESYERNIARALGGLTGDTYGALCEIGEVMALAAFTAWV